MPLGAILRIVAWSVAVAAVGVVALNYEQLPGELPITRWSSATRSPLVALRVPVINLLSLLLVELLARSLARTTLEVEARHVRSALTLAVAVKSVAEAGELIHLPATSPLFAAATICAVLCGIGSSIWLGRRFLRKESHHALVFTFGEKLATTVAIALIVVLQFAPAVQP